MIDPLVVEKGVESFWSWWAGVAPRVAKALDDGFTVELNEPVGKRVNVIDRYLKFEFGRGRKARWYLALSADAEFERRINVQRWLAKAPPADTDWEFHGARQRKPFEGVLSLEGLEIELSEFRVSWKHDAPRRTLHVSVYHSSFVAMGDALRTQAAFQFLDGLLGEDDVERWMGRIQPDVLETPLLKSPLELVTAVDALAASTDDQRFSTLRGQNDDGYPVVATMRLGLKRLDHLLADEHVELRLGVEDPDADGMPKEAEAKVLLELEQQLHDRIGAEAVYLGRESYRGRRALHWHAPFGGPVVGLVEAWQKEHPERRTRLINLRDPEWKALKRW